VIDRRALPALAGAAVAAAAGIVAAANGAPVAGAIAAAGSVAAAAGLLVVGQHPSGAAPAEGSPPAATHPTVEAQGPRTESVTVPGAPVETPSPDPGDADLDDELLAAMPHRIGPTGSEALVDPETGMFSEDYFGVAIEARVAAARRHLRPVAVVLLEVVRNAREQAPTPCRPSEVAEGISTTLREADTACRMDDGSFALVLEDTPENGAIWTVERIRRLLVEADPGRTLWAGVACYPAHAFDSDSLLLQARRALRAAHEWQQDRIEVAIPD